MRFLRLKYFFIGKPIATDRAAHELIPKWKALAVLSSDALSSVAYGTEEVLIPLAAFAATAVAWSMPIALAIAALLTILALSYRQTIHAYPHGGGAYTVAKENLGLNAGLVAGAALLIDYVLTVAVSVAAGIENIASAFPFIAHHKVAFGCIVVLLLMVTNLRGVRESSNVFAFPTYFFILSFIIMFVVGAWQMVTGSASPVAPILHEAYPAIPLFLLLRSFASGCVAVTGTEAISNGVPIFKIPSAQNARTTLTWMAFILGSFFLGVTLLSHVYGIYPQEGETVVAALSRAIFGSSVFYYFIPVSTALILLLAANTSYADFPRLCSLIGDDRYLPRQFKNRGDRLVFSNGIFGLSAAAVFLIILFKGRTHHLIPLYAVGVFISFTLSQLGMVRYHFKHRRKKWLISSLFNGLGALTTFVVLLVVAVTKFIFGAWIVLLVLPCMVVVFRRIHHHYLAVGAELSLIGKNPPPRLEPFNHAVVIPISGIHCGVLEALRYALSLSHNVRACYIEFDPEATKRLLPQWEQWAAQIPLEIIRSPFRSIVRPLLRYINQVDHETQCDMITLIIPEFITKKWYHQFLHNQTAFFIRAALIFKPKIVVTSVRYHLQNT
ncbi:MAG: APC family permease [Deltaproteobacteria bacterium]|nr:APC family permease [Deltaproteobacteria bacterium]